MGPPRCDAPAERGGNKFGADFGGGRRRIAVGVEATWGIDRVATGLTDARRVFAASVIHSSSRGGSESSESSSFAQSILYSDFDGDEMGESIGGRERMMGAGAIGAGGGGFGGAIVAGVAVAGGIGSWSDDGIGDTGSVATARSKSAIRLSSAIPSKSQRERPPNADVFAGDLLITGAGCTAPFVLGEIDDFVVSSGSRVADIDVVSCGMTRISRGGAMDTVEGEGEAEKGFLVGMVAGAAVAQREVLVSPRPIVASFLGELLRE